MGRGYSQDHASSHRPAEAEEGSITRARAFEGMKLPWWDAQATRLQALNRDSEARKGEHYTSEEAWRAAVYTREDLALIVAYASALNRQIAFLCRLLLVLTIIAAVALGKSLLGGFLS